MLSGVCPPLPRAPVLRRCRSHEKDLLYDKRGTVNFRVQYFMSLNIKGASKQDIDVLGVSLLADSTRRLGHGKDTPMSTFLLAASRDFSTYAGTNTSQEAESFGQKHCSMPLFCRTACSTALQSCPVLSNHTRRTPGSQRHIVASSYTMPLSCPSLPPQQLCTSPLTVTRSIHFHGMTALRMLPMEHQPQGLVKQSHARVTITG